MSRALISTFSSNASDKVPLIGHWSYIPLEAKSFQLCAMCFTKLLLFGIDWCILPRDCASFLLSAMRDTNSYLTTHRWGASLKAALHSRCAMSDTKSLHKPLIQGTYDTSDIIISKRLELGGNGVLCFGVMLGQEVAVVSLPPSIHV